MFRIVGAGLCLVFGTQVWASPKLPSVGAELKRISRLSVSLQAGAFEDLIQNRPKLTFSEFMNVHLEVLTRLIYLIDLEHQALTSVEVSLRALPNLERVANKIARIFMQRNKSSLTIQQAVQIARASASMSVQDELIKEFAFKNTARLSGNCAVFLAKGTTNIEERDALLIAYAERALVLSVEHVIQIATGVVLATKHDDILVAYAQRERERSSVDQVSEMLKVANATLNPLAQDQVLEAYARLNQSTLSVEEMIRLAEASSYSEVNLLTDFLRTQSTRVSTENLHDLALRFSSSDIQNLVQGYLKVRGE